MKQDAARASSGCGPLYEQRQPSTRCNDAVGAVDGDVVAQGAGVAVGNSFHIGFRDSGAIHFTLIDSVATHFTLIDNEIHSF